MKYFSHLQFSNLDKLVKYKERLGVSIGLALPVKNEEKTIKTIITHAKKCSPLLDEIIAIDSGSTDKSVRYCKRMNIPVFIDSDIAQKFKVELKRGKGWNLWASTYLLKSDIIVWVDTDVTNFSPRFIKGLVGPMLVDKDIQFVKGYYKRPKTDARVTELLVRPLINQFFPELIPFIQPLAGEYAGRREFLTSIDYFSGYSVETAVLIQAVLNLKSGQIAQSYLGKRIHGLQTIASLRDNLSGSILRTFLILAERYKRVKLNTKLKDYLYSFTSVGGGNFRQEKHFITDVQLPRLQINKKAKR